MGVKTHRIFRYHRHFRGDISSGRRILHRRSVGSCQDIVFETLRGWVKAHGGEFRILAEQIDCALIVEICSGKIDARQIKSLCRLSVVTGAPDTLFRHADGLVVAHRHIPARVEAVGVGMERSRPKYHTNKSPTDCYILN